MGSVCSHNDDINNQDIDLKPVTTKYSKKMSAQERQFVKTREQQAKSLDGCLIISVKKSDFNLKKTQEILKKHKLSPLNLSAIKCIIEYKGHQYETDIFDLWSQSDFFNDTQSRMSRTTSGVSTS